jgi:hypothetical protein
MNDAVDQVRRRENRELRSVGDDRLVGSKHLWLYSAERVPEESFYEFFALRQAALKTSRAWAIKETDPAPPYKSVFAKPHGNTTCNICQDKTAQLTEDHVPPKSCLVERLMQIVPFEHARRGATSGLPISQNGLRFKTLCGKCNSLLGNTYDPALAAFCRAVRGRFGAASVPATKWSVWCQADLAIRSLFGHLIAATTDDAVTLHDAAMRECVLDTSAPLPPTLGVFYWLHLHEEIKVFRTLAMHARRGYLGSHGIFEIMKFFPLGFAVVDLQEYEGLPRLDVLARKGGAYVQVPLSLSLAAPLEWPERPDEWAMDYVVAGRSLQDAVTTRPWRKKPKTTLPV